MSWAEKSCPESDDSEQPPKLDVLPRYNAAKQKFHMRPKVERAPDGMLQAICENGAWFCTKCIRYDLQQDVCKRCERQMKWLPKIF